MGAWKGGTNTGAGVGLVTGTKDCVVTGAKGITVLTAALKLPSSSAKLAIERGNEPEDSWLKIRQVSILNWFTWGGSRMGGFAHGPICCSALHGGIGGERIDFTQNFFRFTTTVATNWTYWVSSSLFFHHIFIWILGSSCECVMESFFRKHWNCQEPLSSRRANSPILKMEG